MARPVTDSYFDYYLITGNLKSKNIQVFPNPFKLLNYSSVSFANAEGKIFAASVTQAPPAAGAGNLLLNAVKL
ncbi:hypothetical protein FAM09_10705 [Niastella caeni]|uniref:Uncharacterized protein n=1 Tax=Niastella caeni TaxID=2569763 RepID=A0A4S8HZP8_9BACT|nr:hypothetical protein [Niastella caeni]THU40329.1 hypothetical protein FAM09_10705 [Niastella caeni]